MKILVTGGNGNIAKIIKNYFSKEHDVVNPSRNELNILNMHELDFFLKNDTYDILVHTAIIGGRRTKDENGEVTHNNLLMLENILHFVDKFKMIINFDSGAIYDRETDILNRKEEELFTIPKDYYGFSKYVIYKRSLNYENFFNLRIFNVFHANEEPDRFIKSCFLSKKNKTPIKIFNDKYFDFIYQDDFLKIIEYYINNVATKNKIEKTINVCYSKKYKLSEIARMIIPPECHSLIEVCNDEQTKNYSGDDEKLRKYNLPMLGLNKSLKMYEKNMNECFFS